jgi:hypothetical protein
MRWLALVTFVASVAVAQVPATAPRTACAVKVAITLTGKSPAGPLATSPTPQSSVDELLKSPAFIERLARFINARFNDQPGASIEEDAPYHLAKHVLSKGLPWREMFLGAFRVETINNQVHVTPDIYGLGYFRSPAWLRRYAGNEEDGLKLSTAYRIVNNVTGVSLAAATVIPGADVSSKGRRSSSCAACHFDNWYALDRLASVLTRRVGSGDQMRFEPPTAGPQTLLNGQIIADDKGLVAALVTSTQFEFNVCRLAFQFVYGRSELGCEGALFDACVDTFRSEKTLQSAIGSLMKDASFCE